MEGYKEVTSAIEGRLFVSTRKHHEASKDNEVYFQSRPQALPSVDSWLSPFTSKIALPSNKTKSSGGEDGEKQQQQKRPSGQARHGHPSPPRSGATARGLPNIKDQAADQTMAVADGFTLSLELAEPILYLEGFDFPHNSEHRSTVLRGVMNLTILKPTTLSALRLNFRGENETIWPEAWRVRKLHKVFREEVVQQTWNFLRTDKNSVVDDITATTTAATTSTTNRNAKQHTRRFEPGQYSFPFERPLESWLPESINLPLGKLSYTLTALAAAGAGEGGQYSSTATLTQPVTLVRIPCVCSLELSEPYEVHGLLHGLRYSFNLAAKSCRVGGQLPMTIKIASPPDRSWQSINVSLVEDMQYQTRNGLAYREQSRTKAVLYTNRAKRDPLHQRALRRISAAGEKMAPSYASGVVIEKKEGDDMWLHRSLSHHEYVTDGGGGGTGTDPDYQYLHEKALLNIPSCSKIDADTAYKCLYVRHYLSITIAAHVQVNENDRKQFQIRIRMPIQILTCKLCDGNATLPVYSENPPLVSGGLSGCEDETTAMPPLPPPSSPPPPADLCRCVSASRSYEGRGSFQSQDG
ncbi:hypothetical protein PV08_07218 [Exophiala spinifera]|uniref:Uncharacterized protein n=1 Tax=Exophiala spinifera TaxID=91928 RepID=A0A0D2B6Y3_9EURO|nr:uncharacterized protein PV08_07218 [Exophiala spinifera]KIW14435.1 hypothetical protein PV08_07218 [Exophiala spinifera]